MNTGHSIFLIAIASGITFLIRAFPFLVFKKRQMPAFIKEIADKLPPAIIAVLVIYCLKGPLTVPSTETIAAAIAIRKNSHLQIDVLINCFKPRTKVWFTLVSTLVGMVFLVFLLIYSIGLVQTGGSNISVGLNIPMSIPYASIPIGVVLMLLTSVEVVLKSIEDLKEGGKA